MDEKDTNNKIYYIYDDNLVQQCDKLPSMLERASVVQDLINNYDLLKSDNVVAVNSIQATEVNLKDFHSSAYVEFLKKTNDCDDLDEFEEEQEEFGLLYDCPLLENCYDFTLSVAGATLTAANILCHGLCTTVINWFGGWHHAQRDKAEGFCYVNDIVLGIQRLQKKFSKVLYIDLDVHHGDGVQNAFEYSKHILTLSFHKKSLGFYPGTGSINEIGRLNGTYYTINVPFLEGIGDKSYSTLFNKVFPRVYEAFSPDVIVVQCGGDILYGDHVGQCNVSIQCMGSCLKRILNCNKPCLLLGGGGYNIANTARYWTYITALVLGKEIDDDIPVDSDYFPLYGPSYALDIGKGNMKDCNTEEYINSIVETTTLYCDHIINT